ncbi:DgyrCDS2969 [Dimorphilus gyrociliatus]|uniref:DgyrCDS2969 n=1 Tax=Dimorphilus gyrociliatus TaxID=2664684 RepID=A0A7I8VDK7_9ANNE|nr:DgyrCDS2969 [Dimorphilus gyrociliatus]
MTNSEVKAESDEEMEHESLESSKSEGEESGSDTESGDEYHVSDLNDEDFDKKKTNLSTDMAYLEKQFENVKNDLYNAKLRQANDKIDAITKNIAPEYVIPLDKLRDQREIRRQVAKILREMRVKSNENKYEYEVNGARQSYESDRFMLSDNVRSELEEKIRKLEEDRHNIDITSDLFMESQSYRKTKKKTSAHEGLNEKRRKPVAVTGPYIVYMLEDSEIIEDWTAIRKILKQGELGEKKKKDIAAHQHRPLVPEKSYSEKNVHFDNKNNRLIYEGEVFSKDDNITIDMREDSPAL